MVQKEQIYIKPYKVYRTLHIYLPKDYYESSQQYPVMYMFDGHNLFYDQDATYGKSWGLKDFLDHYEKPLIIVGLECNHEGNERLKEFSPYSFSIPKIGSIYGTGDQLMSWMATELKSWVDQRFRTYPQRECTGLGGSSMGGLMSLYGVIHYNKVFSKAACLSPAIFGCKERLIEEMAQKSISPDTRVYISLGSEEIPRGGYFQIQRLNDAKIFEEAFKSRGASSVFHIIEGGQHNEASWEKENRMYLDYLWRS